MLVDISSDWRLDIGTLSWDLVQLLNCLREKVGSERTCLQDGRPLEHLSPGGGAVNRLEQGRSRARLGPVT